VSDCVAQRGASGGTTDSRGSISRTLAELMSDGGTGTSANSFRTGGKTQRERHKQCYSGHAESARHVVLLCFWLFGQLSS
jgi:hypothetical protein